MTFLFATAVFPSHVEVRWIDDEPRAVIEAAYDGVVTAKERSAIVATEGYRRLRDRELGMNRPFVEDEFFKFLDALPAKPDQYQSTLQAWAQIDFRSLAAKASYYLPEGARLDASVYPLIKPKQNSFVWDVTNKPAIMLYLDPAMTPEEVAMTVCHELHHIGYANSCPSSEFSAWVKRQSTSLQEAWKWAGALGEGYAVLAAASDRNRPVNAAKEDVKAAWDDGMSHLARDLSLVARFLSGTATGEWDIDAAGAKAREFYGTQGPWYTVGFVVATTIEEAFGRRALIKVYEDPRQVFTQYNAAVRKLKKDLPVWPQTLINSMKGNS